MSTPAKYRCYTSVSIELKEGFSSQACQWLSLTEPLAWLLTLVSKWTNGRGGVFCLYLALKRLHFEFQFLSVFKLFFGCIWIWFCFGFNYIFCTLLYVIFPVFLSKKKKEPQRALISFKPFSVATDKTFPDNWDAVIHHTLEQQHIHDEWVHIPQSETN